MAIAVGGDGKGGACLSNVVCEDSIQPATVVTTEDDGFKSRDATPVNGATGPAVPAELKGVITGPTNESGCL